MDLVNYCHKENGIVFQAFAPLGHSSEPNVLADPVVTSIANRVGKTPAQVLLAWYPTRDGAPDHEKTPSRLAENFESPPFPTTPCRRSGGIKTQIRFNSVVETGVPGFIRKK